MQIIISIQTDSNRSCLTDEDCIKNRGPDAICSSKIHLCFIVLDPKLKNTIDPKDVLGCLSDADCNEVFGSNGYCQTGNCYIKPSRLPTTTYHWYSVVGFVILIVSAIAMRFMCFQLMSDCRNRIAYRPGYVIQANPVYRY